MESLIRITRSVVIYSFQFTKALEQVLTESPLLGMHTGIVHLAWSQSDNEADLLKGCKYVWTHRDHQPWGQPLPIQCPQCGTVQKWSSIYLNDGSYKFECTYIKCGDRGNERHGPRHTISVQRPEVGEMLPKCNGGQGAWMKTPIKLAPA